MTRRSVRALLPSKAMAVLGRKEPFALGRRLRPEALREFGEAAKRLDLRPRLLSSVGWRAPGR